MYTTIKEYYPSVAQVLLVLALVLFSSSASFGQEHTELGHTEDGQTKSHDHSEKGEFNAGDMIMEHISDAYDIHLWGHTSIPLPVILYTDAGLHVFSSGSFDHGHAVVESKGEHFVLAAGKVYQTDEHGTLMYCVANESNPEVCDSETAVNFADTHHSGFEAPDGSLALQRPMDFSITKSVFGLLFVLVLVCILFLAAAKGYKKRPGQAPKGITNALEPLILFVRDEIAIPSIGKKHAHRFMPFLLTVFFFIWLCNLLGLIPFIGGFNITGTLSVTMVLAAIVFVITTVNANKHYWGHILWPPGVPLPIKFILIPIEIVGIFLKPIVLMVRLTANITAGHIIILAFVSLVLIFGKGGEAMGAGFGVGIGATLFMIFMFFIELLVAFLQAFVFTLLAALYFGDATQEAHH